jgi:hypothetical protein
MSRRPERKTHWEQGEPLYLLAEGAGFEPAVRLHGLRFSRPVHSTALPPLRGHWTLDFVQAPGEVAEWLKALAC